MLKDGEGQPQKYESVEVFIEEYKVSRPTIEKHIDRGEIYTTKGRVRVLSR